MKRFVVESSDTFHRTVKQYCVACGITFQCLILELLEQELDSYEKGESRFKPEEDS